MKKVRTIAVCVAVFVAATTLAHMARARMQGSPVLQARATWKENHSSLASLAHSADIIVTATVAEIRAGRVVFASDDLDGSSLQFSDVGLRVRDVIKGDVQTRDNITIEVVGDYFSGDTRAKIPHIRVEPMPAFAAGRRFLLFLKRQTSEPYHWRLVNNQGAFDLVGGHLGSSEMTRAVDQHDRVAAELDRLTLSIASERIRVSLREKAE